MFQVTFQTAHLNVITSDNETINCRDRIRMVRNKIFSSSDNSQVHNNPRDLASTIEGINVAVTVELDCRGYATAHSWFEFPFSLFFEGAINLIFPSTPSAESRPPRFPIQRARVEPPQSAIPP